MEELMPGGCLVVSTMGAAQDTSARNGIIPSKNAVIAMSTEVMPITHEAYVNIIEARKAKN